MGGLGGHLEVLWAGGPGWWIHHQSSSGALGGSGRGLWLVVEPPGGAMWILVQDQWSRSVGSWELIRSPCVLWRR